MTTPSQSKPNPVPAILVYGTPSGPAFTQASWFRAEDKEAVRAAAQELKLSIIELQTDADKALAAGAHEGVLKGSAGRMIIGSVSAEVYRRIEEHVRKAAGAPTLQAGDHRGDDSQTHARTKHEHRRGGSKLAGTFSRNTGCAGHQQAGQRDCSRNAARWREGPGRLLEREA